jgi:carbon-monoxide dehydrogenase large subunit
VTQASIPTAGRDRYLGERVPRREDADLLTGRARTVADLGPEDTGCPEHALEAVFVRSPAALGRLGRVDLTAARTLPGVLGAWSAADLPDLPPTTMPPSSRGAHEGLDWPSLAVGRVRYVGQPVAVVLADTRGHAEDAARTVAVEVEALAALLDPTDAALGSATRLFEGRSNVVTEEDLGGVDDEVFSRAAVVVECDLRQQRVLPTSLEARSVLAAPAPDGGLTVWASHQAQHNLRAGIAEALGVPPELVRVVVPATGGAFGAKSQVYPEHVVVAALARRLGRPVRWVEDRAEAMLAATRGRGQRQRTRLAADAEGRFLAYELLVDADIGGYPHTGAGVPGFTAHMATGAYGTPQVHARTRCVLTSSPPTSAYRGAGRPEAAYAIERSVDVLARRLGLDPAELRRRNHLRPDQFPHETPTGRTYDSGDYTAAMDKALELAGYADLRAEQRRRRADGGRPLGIGVATYVERSGGPPDSDEHGAVEVHADGTVLARVGSTSTGQGHATAFAQLVASALGLPLETVRVVQNDTAEVPYGFGTFGSRSMQVGGNALWQAADGLVELARQRFADACGAPLDEVRYDGGRLSCGDRSSTLAELAAGAPLRADARPSLPQAFPFGAYVAVVEVDPDLGTVEVQRLVAVDDYGVVVNPLLVDGQGLGSIAQGLGQALLEEAGTDADGVPVQRTLLDYLLPTAADLPPVTLAETCTPNPHVPFGAKGAGEAGCIGVPPALVGAVCDALDVDHVDMPLTPEAVWRAMAGHRGGPDSDDDRL